MINNECVDNSDPKDEGDNNDGYHQYGYDDEDGAGRGGGGGIGGDVFQMKCSPSAIPYDVKFTKSKQRVLIAGWCATSYKNQ